MNARSGFIYMDILFAVFIMAGLLALAAETAAYERSVLASGRRLTAVYLAEEELERLKNGLAAPGSASFQRNRQTFFVRRECKAEHFSVRVIWQDGGAEKSYDLLLRRMP